MPNISGTTYYLSAEALEYLITQAKFSGHINPKSTAKMKGLSKYVDYLSTLTYKDTRPIDIQASDLDRLSAGKAPYWSDESERLPIRLSLSIKATTNLWRIATEFQITNHRRKDSANSMTGTISAILEAIGIGWLKEAPPISENLLTSTNAADILNVAAE